MKGQKQIPVRVSVSPSLYHSETQVHLSICQSEFGTAPPSVRSKKHPEKTKDTRDRGCGPCVSKPQKQGGAVAPPCVRNQRHRKQKTQKTPVAGAVALACLKNEAKNSAMSNGSKKGQVARAFSKKSHQQNQSAKPPKWARNTKTHPQMDRTARQPVQCEACGSGGGPCVLHTVPVEPPV